MKNHVTSMPWIECENCGSRRVSTLLKLSGSIHICKDCNASRLQLESMAHTLRKIQETRTRL